MKIVIDIPDEAKKAFDNAENNELNCGFYDHGGVIASAIRNGTELPKGHGRLIDVNDLLDDINLEDNDYNRDVNTGEIITLENIDRIPTILEADKGVNIDEDSN